MLCHYAEYRNAKCHVLSFIMLSVVMLSVCIIFNYAEYHYVECSYAGCHVLFSIMPNVIRLSVVMLSVVAPSATLLKIFNLSSLSSLRLPERFQNSK